MEITENHIVNARKPGTQQTNRARISSSESTGIPKNHSNIKKVDIKSPSPDRNERRLPMVLKKVSDINIGVTSDQYSLYWLSLKEAGIPTVPTLRVVDEDTVLVTDMTHDGSEFFGKSAVYPSFEKYTDCKLGPNDYNFLNIDPVEIQSKAEQIAVIATEKNIYLPIDDPFDILVHPDGSWEIIVLDLYEGRPPVPVGRNNMNCVDKLMKYVKLIRTGLTGTGKPPMLVM